MNTIVRGLLEALQNHQEFKKSNTEVKVTQSMLLVYLHNNLILRRHLDQNFTEFTLAGWDTDLTRNRLRVMGINLERKKGTTYYGGKVISLTDWIVA